MAGEGETVAIVNHNEPAFYCVPAKAYELLMERLEDAELNTIADARRGEPASRSPLMSYGLGFLAPALTEWEKLNSTVRERLKKKLAQRLESVREPAA